MLSLPLLSEQFQDSGTARWQAGFAGGSCIPPEATLDSRRLQRHTVHATRRHSADSNCKGTPDLGERLRESKSSSSKRRRQLAVPEIYRLYPHEHQLEGL